MALDYGFASHANFTRAFKGAFGITPEAYKKNRPFLNTFVKPEVSMAYVMVDENVPLIVGNIVLEIRRERIHAPELYLGLSTDVSIIEQNTRWREHRRRHTGEVVETLPPRKSGD